MIPLLMACQAPPAPDDVDAAVVATTLAVDYTTGTLTGVDHDGVVHDHLATVHADAVVRALGDDVLVINRLQVDTIRRYASGRWSAPVWEASTGRGTNPQDAAPCGDALVVSRYEVPSLLLLDPASGVRLGEIDLSAWADDDGVPEAADLAPLGDGRVAVGLQRLRRLDGWAPEPRGRVAVIDCASRSVAYAWETGPNPVVRAIPGGVRALTADGVTDFDAAGDPLGPTWSPPAGAPVDAAIADAGDVLVTRDGPDHTIWCGGAEVWTGDRYLSSVAIDPEGVAWIAARPGWTDPGAPAGLQRLRLDGCALEPELLRTDLPPFSVAALP